MVYMAKQLHFLFNQTRGYFSKNNNLYLDPCASCVVDSCLLFYCDFGAEAFPSYAAFQVMLRTCFTVDMILLYLLTPASSQGPQQLFQYLFTPFAQVCFSLGDKTCLLPEQYCGCVVPMCLQLHSIFFVHTNMVFMHLEVAPKDEPKCLLDNLEILFL